MANSNEEPVKASSNTETALPQNKKRLPEAKSPKATNLQSTLALLIAAIALILALYALYSNQQLGRNNNQQNQDLNALMAELKAQQLEAKESLTTMKERISQTETAWQGRIQELSKNLQNAMQQHLYQKQDWLVLKARYYLELAQINAHWSDDQQATIALLQQADTLLQNISDQRLFKVRQAIAKEIVQLQNLPKIDMPGLLSQLDAIQTVINNLPMRQALNDATSNNETKAGDNTLSPWREKLNNSMNTLEKLVVIRHNDTDIQPLLSPLHQSLSRDLIRLNLQEAQWAILQSNPAVYQLALNQALTTIKRTFDEHAEATQALIKQLEALKQEKLIATKPVLENSLPLLNQWIDSRGSQTINISAPSEGDKSQ